MPTQEKWQSKCLQKVPRTNGITLTKLESSDRSSKDWQTNTLLRPGWQASQGNRDTFRIRVSVTLMLTQRDGNRQVCRRFPKWVVLFDQTGKAVTGLVGQTLYFTQDGKQVKGKVVDGIIVGIFRCQFRDMARSKWIQLLLMYFDRDGRGQTSEETNRM